MLALPALSEAVTHRCSWAARSTLDSHHTSTIVHQTSGSSASSVASELLYRATRFASRMEWRRLLRYARSVCRPVAWCVRLAGLAAGAALPVMCGFQMLVLDYVLAGESPTDKPWVWLFCASELCLVGHLVVNNTQMHSVRSGHFQWVVYSWLISIKICLLFFRALPDLRDGETDVARGRFMSTGRIVMVLWLTPLFYAILTFRTLGELVATGNLRKEKFLEAKHRLQELWRDLEEHSRMDVVLLTDMVWHVFIDMADVIYMISRSSPHDDDDSIMDPVFMKERPETVEHIRRAIGSFAFLGMFFHQQSFPRAAHVVAPRATLKATPAPPRGPRGSLQTMASAGPAAAKSDGRLAADYWVDVLQARKRSAVVSILMVDLPFLIIRTYIILLPVYAQAEPLNRFAFREILPQVDKWWVKNLFCLVLQAMQLQFVLQADFERTSNLCGWDVHISATKATIARAVGARRRNANGCVYLAELWQELDSCQLPAALEGTGSPSSSGDDSTDDRTDIDSKEHGRGGRVLTPRRLLLPLFLRPAPIPSEARRPGRPPTSCLRSCLCCCCRRSRTCCGCKCSSGILVHALMGLVLGWLIAKVDFANAATVLVMN